MFWISQVLFNLDDCPSKARCFINMTIPHEWNWSSFYVLLLGILFVHQDRCKLFSRISFFGRNNPTGLLFSYSTTTIPWWWSEELKLCQLDSLAMAFYKNERGCNGTMRVSIYTVGLAPLLTHSLQWVLTNDVYCCCIFNMLYFHFIFLQVFHSHFCLTRAKLA